MKRPPKIWIVDDDKTVRDALHVMMSANGYGVVEFPDGQDAVDRLVREQPSLLLLDVEMPRLDGWRTLEEARRLGCACPILMMTRVHDVPSRVRGLEAGADDYLGKPFEPAELLARVNALLRRAPPPAGTPELHLRDVVVDFEKNTASKGGKPLRLTRTDFAFLKLLWENRGSPVSRERMLIQIWQGRAQNSHALDTHLWRLRKKMGDDGADPVLICNVPGIGYVISPE